MLPLLPSYSPLLWWWTLCQQWLRRRGMQMQLWSCFEGCLQLMWMLVLQQKMKMDAALQS